jgi:peroxiredoxin
LPRLKELEAKYRDRGLAVVGVSLDDDLEALEAAVAEHEIPWPQVCDGEGIESMPVALYRIEGISAFVLIDPEGKIVQRYHWIDFPPETDFLDLVEEQLEARLTN